MTCRAWVGAAAGAEAALFWAFSCLPLPAKASFNGLAFLDTALRYSAQAHKSQFRFEPCAYYLGVVAEAVAAHKMHPQCALQHACGSTALSA